MKEIKLEIITCKSSRILTSNDEGNYDVASEALSSQAIMQGIKQYVVQYNMTSIIMIHKGAFSLFTPPSITFTMVWLDTIKDYDKLEDSNYSAWQEFILHHGLDVKIESYSWLEGIFLLSI